MAESGFVASDWDLNGVLEVWVLDLTSFAFRQLVPSSAASLVH